MKDCPDCKRLYSLLERAFEIVQYESGGLKDGLIYGKFVGDNPLEFEPDTELNTPEELERLKIAQGKYRKGEDWEQRGLGLGTMTVHAQKDWNDIAPYIMQALEDLDPGENEYDLHFEEGQLLHKFYLSNNKKEV